MWQRRIVLLRAAAKETQRWDLLSFLEGMETAHPEWFDGVQGLDAKPAQTGMGAIPEPQPAMPRRRVKGTPSNDAYL